MLAFLDLFPQSFGHTLVIPKRSAACNLLDVDSEALRGDQVVQKLTRAIVAELEPDGVQVAQFNGAPAGQTVFHIHMHIVPRYAGEGLGIHAAGKADPAGWRSCRRACCTHRHPGLIAAPAMSAAGALRDHRSSKQAPKYNSCPPGLRTLRA